MRPRHLKCALLLVLCAAADAQFSQLGVSDDGSQAYFATGLRLPSEASQNLPNTAAIYRIVNGVIERLTDPPGFNPLPFHANADGNPQFSADGRVFVYTEYSNCYGGSACITFPPTSTSFLTVAGVPYGKTLTGEAQVSRNGRFELNGQHIWATGHPYTQTVEWRDLNGGTMLEPPVVPAYRRQALTGDGRVLGLDPQTRALTLWSPQSTQTLQPSESPQSAIVNDTGSWVVYDAPAGFATRLHALDPATGRDIVLASRPSTSTTLFHESISADGSTVLYLGGQPTQAFLIHPDGAGLRQLTSFPEGVDEAVLSGNGRTVIAATGGRLVSIDVTSGAVKELIPATPLCYGTQPALVPGSLSSLVGAGLTAGPLRLNGVAVPVLNVSAAAIWFQVPWDAQPGGTATLSLPSASPFNGCAAFQAPIFGRAPYFYVGTGFYLLVAHQDFSGLVTPESPAKPGEVITAYALGLGAVSPPIDTGAVTPVDRLYPVTAPFACYQGFPVDQGPALEVPFAGLAPGMIGIYQVNIRMPDPPPGLQLSLNCGTPENGYERASGIVPIADASVRHPPR
jgi:uncharacterized protein (TIGR03437 family)